MQKKYIYRFKTAEELHEEIGSDWMSFCEMNGSGYMNYLLGSKININITNINLNGDLIQDFRVENKSPHYTERRFWSIKKRMILKIKLNTAPSYEPRKFVYE